MHSPSPPCSCTFPFYSRSVVQNHVGYLTCIRIKITEIWNRAALHRIVHSHKGLPNGDSLFVQVLLCGSPHFGESRGTHTIFDTLCGEIVISYSAHPADKLGP